MHFRRHLLAISMAAALTQLAACGGSSSSTPTPTPEPPAPEPTQSLSGTTADGYLVNAQVCLDLNNNNECDPSEPTTQSQSGGQFHFDNLDGDLDLTQARVLVKVIAGQTEDEDAPGILIDQGYTMTAPAGVNAFISPLTTMLAAEVKNSDLDLETATAALEQSLGIQGSELSVLDDYIAGKQHENGQGYDRIHKVAQVVARVTAAAHKAMAANGGTGGDANDSEVADAIADTVAENLELLVASVDQSEASGDDTDVDAIADQVNEALPLAPEEVQEQVEENREHAHKQHSDLMEIITQERGMFELGGHEQRSYQADSQTCIAERELSYQQIQLQEQQVQFNRFGYQGAELGFTASDDDDRRDTLIWKQGSWQSMDNAIHIESVQEDGSVIVESDVDGRQQVWARKLDLTDLKMKRYANGEKVWMHQLSSDLRFPADAQGYQLTFRQLSQRALLSYDPQCDAQTQWCNQVNLPTGPAQQLQQLLANAAGEAPLIYIGGEEGTSLAVRLYGSLEQQQGDLRLFVVQHQHCDDSGCGQPQAKDGGSWHLTDFGLQLSLPQWTQSLLGEDNASALLTVHDGLVRHAYLIDEGTTRSNDWSFNGSAIDALIEGLGAPSLRQELPLSECGVHHPGDGTDPGDGTEPGDGDQPGDGDDKPAPPELVADPTATAALTGTQYLAEGGDFQALIQFGAQGQLLTWVDDIDEGQVSHHRNNGRWVIDADQQLLLQFDGGDWALLQLADAELGADVMKASELDNGVVEAYPLSRIRPLALEPLSQPQSFRLTADDEAQCSMTLHLNGSDNHQQGSGWVDLSQCADDSDSGVNQEFLWAQTDAGFKLQPIMADGSVDPETLMLSRFGSGPLERVLMRTVSPQADGQRNDDMLESFRFEWLP
ncbi:hypothetical protein [Ferrimonas kyonanensis]|uniref:hypothetical protein n=1 Tax=Ferrimonas kyonanensis TaxID=364763 RepID=UPI00040DD9BF|nr:hypothetical protein [Ferrimonas kyonanensis]